MKHIIRKKRVLLVVALLFVYTDVFSQAFSEVAFLHSRFVTDTTNSESITAYWFDGSQIKIDTILKRIAPKKGKQESRVSVGLSDQLIKNRYLYTTIGLLIDLKQKKILVEDPGNFVKEQDGLIFFTPKGYRKNFILNTYNPATGKTKKVLERRFENSLKYISPDYNHLIEVSYAELDHRKIFLLNRRGKEKLILPDLGKGPIRYGGSHAFGRIPVKWLSNDQFIYAKYSQYSSKGAVWVTPEKDETDSTEIQYSGLAADTLPCCKGEFRIYNIKTQEDKLIVFSDSIYAPSIDDRFLEIDSQLIFRNSGFSYLNYWQINLKNPSINKYSFKSTFTTKTDTSYQPSGLNYRKTLVYFKGKEIGYFYGHHSTGNDSTFIACGRLEPGGKTYIMFWNVQNQQWVKSELNGFLGLMSFFKPSWEY